MTAAGRPRRPRRPPPRRLRLADGRALAFDDVGMPGGPTVVYLHGTPDSRLARHPDDGVTADAGVRLVAVDRPGYGRSDPQPPGSPPGLLAGDVAALLDALGVERCAVLGWSGGALGALAVAAGLPGRVAALGIVAGVVPCQAYDDPDVRDAAPQRISLIELARVLPAGELGATVAPVLAPYPCDRKLAAEHQAEQRDAVSAAEVAAVPGAERELAEALVEGVRSGLAGVEADVEAQYQPFPVDLQSIRGANRLWWGAEDTVTPPVFGAWYAAQLPGAELDLEAGAGHHVLLTRWATIVRALADLV